MIKIALILLLTLNLHPNSLTLYGILKERYNGVNLLFYNPLYGYINCNTFGINTPDNIFKTNCNIDNRRFKELSFYAKLYMQRYTHLEQKYKLEFRNSLCVLYSGGDIYNEEIVKSGYAFIVNTKVPLEFEKLKRRLLYFEEIAKREKRGLWKEWGDEMECLREEIEELVKQEHLK